MQLLVRYTATFETLIEVEDRDVILSLQQEFKNDIFDIEPGTGEYQSDTWEVESVLIPRCITVVT